MVSIMPQTFVADLSISGAYGMAIVSLQAFTAGVASIPRPFDNADWSGWFVWRSFHHRLEFIDGTGFALGSWSAEVDSKAMRKVDANSVIVLVAESQTGAFDIAMHLRMLLLLS